MVNNKELDKPSEEQKDLIEELLDTIEVFADEETLNAIKHSGTDFEKGNFESFSTKKEIEDFIDSL